MLYSNSQTFNNNWCLIAICTCIHVLIHSCVCLHVAITMCYKWLVLWANRLNEVALLCVSVSLSVCDEWCLIHNAWAC